MIKRCILALFLVCPPLFAHELSSFKAITKHLTDGKEIVSVLDMSKCEIDDPNEFKVPRSNVTTRPSAVLYTKELLAFDGVKFAHGRPPLPENGIMQRVSFILNNEGNANIILVFFDAVSNQKIPGFNNVKIQCKLGEGVHIFKR